MKIHSTSALAEWPLNVNGHGDTFTLLPPRGVLGTIGTNVWSPLRPCPLHLLAVDRWEHVSIVSSRWQQLGLHCCRSWYLDLSVLTRCLMVRQLSVVWVGWLLFSTPTIVVSFVGRFLGGFHLAFCKYSSFALNFVQYTLLRSCAQVRVCVWSLVALTRRPVVQILILQFSGQFSCQFSFSSTIPSDTLSDHLPRRQRARGRGRAWTLGGGRWTLCFSWSVAPRPGHAICKAPPLWAKREGQKKCLCAECNHVGWKGKLAVAESEAGRGCTWLNVRYREWMIELGVADWIIYFDNDEQQNSPCWQCGGRWRRGSLGWWWWYQTRFADCGLWHSDYVKS